MLQTVFICGILLPTVVTVIVFVGFLVCWYKLGWKDKFGTQRQDKKMNSSTASSSEEPEANQKHIQTVSRMENEMNTYREDKKMHAYPEYHMMDGVHQIQHVDKRYSKAPQARDHSQHTHLTKWRTSESQTWQPDVNANDVIISHVACRHQPRSGDSVSDTSQESSGSGSAGNYGHIVPPATEQLIHKYRSRDVTLSVNKQHISRDRRKHVLSCDSVGMVPPSDNYEDVHIHRQHKYLSVNCGENFV